MSGLFGNTQNTGGGLFGGQKPNTGGGGLFGGNNANSSTGGGGLFGGSNPQGSNMQPSGGLFGGGAQQPSTGGGGMFGGGASQPNTGGGLFGGSNNQPKAGGLFGGSSGGGGGGGGLFGGGNAQPAPSSGGLFGGSMNKPAGNPGGGIFGGGNTSTGMSGSAGGGGGLFGAKPAGNTGGGLFGGGGAAANNSQSKSSFFSGGASSSFGGQGAQPAQNQPTTSGFGGGSAFGSTSQANPVGGGGGGGLFGSSAPSTQAKPAGGLFGASKPAGSSLFGGGGAGTTTAAPAFGKPAGGGLFGSSGATASFGNNGTATTPSTGGGLFGGNAPKPAGGLFGGGGGATAAKPAFGSSATGGFGSTSSFGGSKPSGFGSSSSGFGQSSGGGFGSNSGTTGGGLFGSSNNTAASGGSTLFGNNNTASTGGGGLFSGNKFGGQAAAPTAQPTQFGQQPVDNSYIQAYTALNQDPYGTKGIQEALNLKSFDTKEQEVIQRIAQQVLSYKEDPSSKAPTHYLEENDIFSRFSKLHTNPITLKLNHRGENTEFNGSFKRPDNPYMFKKSPHKVDRAKESQNREMEYNRVKQDDDYLMYTNKFLKSLGKDKNSTTSDSFRTLNKESAVNPKVSQTFKREDEDVMELTGPNIVKVKVSVFIEDSEELLLLSIDKTQKVKQLVKLAIDKLKNKYCGIDCSLIQIIHKSRILNIDNTLEDSGVQSGMTFTMLVQEQQTQTPSQSTKLESTAEFKRAAEPKAKESTQYVSREKLPILRDSSYRITPDIIEMARMSEFDLMNIKDLTIENDSGKIHWPGSTDVIEVNFDEIVKIRDFSATVYPEEVEVRGMKPEVGQKLNKPAVITLYKIVQSIKEKDKMNNHKSRSISDFRESLKKRCEQLESCTFIDYDKAACSLSFRVEHFTKYSFLEAMSEDQEESQRQEESDQDSEDRSKNAPDARIQSIQKVYETERLSFGKEEPKGFAGTYTPVTNGEMHEMDPISEGEGYQEEYADQENRMYAPKAGNFLDDIREESQSQKSSAYVEEEHDVDMDNQQLKKHKIYFGDIAQKEFHNEEPYQYQEYYEEEGESEQGNFEEVPSVEEIRNKIKSNKHAIQQSLMKLKNTRADKKQRKRQKESVLR